MRSTSVLVRLQLRRYRIGVVVGVAAIVALVGGTVPGYASVYPTLADRGPLVAELRGAAATEILYGELPLPGTLGQLAQWETGAYVVLLTAALAILLTIAVTRADEESGITESVLAGGPNRWTVPASAMVFTLVVFVAVGLGVGGVLALEAIGNSELTMRGAAAFGCVITLVGLLSAATTALLAEICWDTAATRTAAWGAFGLSVALRIAADFVPAPGLRWLTWAGVKDLVRPFTEDRVLPLVVAAGVVVALWSATFACRRLREFGGGLVRPPTPAQRRLRVTTPGGLGRRLDRTRVLVWSVPVVAVAGVFGGMSRNLVDVIEADARTAELMRGVTAVDDAVEQYFTFSSLFVAALVACCAVAFVLRARAEERAGYLDVAAALGVARWRPLVARTAFAATVAVVLLAIGAAAQAIPTAVRADDPQATRWAWAAVVGHAPGVLLATGVAALLVGSAPRLAAGAWLVVGWSAFAVLFGDLVHVPAWARDLTVFDYGLRAGGGDSGGLLPWSAVVVLGLAAVVAAAAGAVATARRDISVN